MPLYFHAHAERLLARVPSDLVAGFLTYDGFDVERQERQERLYAINPVTRECWTRTQKAGGHSFNGINWLPCDYTAIPPHAEWIGQYKFKGSADE